MTELLCGMLSLWLFSITGAQTCLPNLSSTASFFSDQDKETNYPRIPGLDHLSVNQLCHEMILLVKIPL